MMTEYTILFDREFNKKFRKLDKSLQKEAEKKILRLKSNPQEGKPMRYFSNLFELHVRMYRIFYLVDNHQIKILMIGVEHKEDTDKFLRSLTSDEIKRLSEENL